VIIYLNKTEKQKQLIKNQPQINADLKNSIQFR